MHMKRSMPSASAAYTPSRSPNCRRFEAQRTTRAVSRAPPRAGRSSETKSATMLTTTSNSIKANPKGRLTARLGPAQTGGSSWWPSPWQMARLSSRMERQLFRLSSMDAWNQSEIFSTSSPQEHYRCSVKYNHYFPLGNLCVSNCFVG